MRTKEEQQEKDQVVDQNKAGSPAEESIPEEAKAPGVDDEKDQVMKLKEEIEGAKDKYIRLYSEFENFRRRTAREKLEMVQSANEQLIKSLLPVADDFLRAEKASKESAERDIEGFLLIHNKFRKILEMHGVAMMDIPQGSDFDVDRHEAVSQVPTPDDSLKGKIVEVVENGYLLNDKVIRFAKVVVGG